MKKILGKPTINPFIFFSGKTAGFIAGTTFFIQFVLNLNQFKSIMLINIISYILFGAGLIIIGISLSNLGSSTTVGIPEKKTEFKTNGLYKISRNPMYLGFNCLSIAAILHTMNFIVLAVSIYSIVVHHIIILGEEKFLMKEFGNDYKQYCSSVRRYI